MEDPGKSVRSHVTALPWIWIMINLFVSSARSWLWPGIRTTIFFFLRTISAVYHGICIECGCCCCLKCARFLLGWMLQVVLQWVGPHPSRLISIRRFQMTNIIRYHVKYALLHVDYVIQKYYLHNLQINYNLQALVILPQWSSWMEKGVVKIVTKLWSWASVKPTPLSTPKYEMGLRPLQSGLI